MCLISGVGTGASALLLYFNTTPCLPKHPNPLSSPELEAEHILFRILSHTQRKVHILHATLNRDKNRFSTNTNVNVTTKEREYILN